MYQKHAVFKGTCSEMFGKLICPTTVSSKVKKKYDSLNSLYFINRKTINPVMNGLERHYL